MRGSRLVPSTSNRVAAFLGLCALAAQAALPALHQRAACAPGISARAQAGPALGHPRPVTHDPLRCPVCQVLAHTQRFTALQTALVPAVLGHADDATDQPATRVAAFSTGPAVPRAPPSSAQL